MKKKKSNREIAARAVARSKEQLRRNLVLGFQIFMIFALGFFLGKFDGQSFSVLLVAVAILFFILDDYIE